MRTVICSTGPVYCVYPQDNGSFHLGEEYVAQLTNWCKENCTGWWMVDYKGMQFDDINDAILAELTHV